MGGQRITFSTNRSLVGSEDPVLSLFFKEEVLVSLEQFADQKPKGEHGGFLVGYRNKQSDSSKYVLYVERFVPIPQRKDASRLVINREHFSTVKYALKNRDRQEEILGWVHTHPGFGVFLSKYDQIQHKRHFNKPWQIALVIDRLSQEKTVYCMDDNGLRTLSGYYVMQDLPEENKRKDEHINFGVRLFLGMAILVFLISIISVSYSWLWYRLRSDPIPLEVVSDLDLEPLGDYEEIEAIIIYEEEKLERQEFNEELSLSNSPLYSEYVVQEGDNLWTISKTLLGDANLFPLLIELNEVQNPRIIREGTIIKIPLNIVK